MRKQNNINSARKAYGYDFERNLQNLINNTNFRRKTSLRKPGHSPFMPSPYKPEQRTKDVRKKMRKQNNINPAIANDPNDPLKRIIQREGTQGKQAISMQELQEILRSLYPENFPRPRPIGRMPRYPDFERWPVGRMPRYPDVERWPESPGRPRPGPMPIYPDLRPRPRPDGRMPIYPDVDPRPRPRPGRPRPGPMPIYPGLNPENFPPSRRPRPNPWTLPLPYNPRNPWGDSDYRTLPSEPRKPKRPGYLPAYPERPIRLPIRWNDEKPKPRTMDWRFDRDGYPPGHPAYDPNDPRSIKPIPLSKRMKKQNTINPAIANDPNDPLKRIIRREGTQTQSGSGNNDYISPERFARRKGYLPGGIKRPRRTPTYEGQMPADIVRPKTKPTYEGQMPAGIKGWRTLPSSPFHKPEYRTLPSSPFHKPKVIRFGKSMSKRAIPTQRTDNTRNKYGI